MSHPSRRLLVLVASAFLAFAPGAHARVPQALKPIHNSHAVEGQPATVEIRLPRRTAHPVTVSWATEPGTAKAGTDYTAASGEVTIAKGTRRASLVVQTLRDKVDELTEEFRVRFSKPEGAPLLSRTSTIVRVIDRNPAIAAIARRTVVEPGATGETTPIGAVITLRGASAGRRPVTIGYDIVGNDDTVNGDDATLGTGRLRFARGVTRMTIPGSIKGDAVDEFDEELLIVLTGDRGVYARPGASVTITDDPGDTPPTVSIGDISAPENSSGAVEVPITLSAPSELPVTVKYTTAPGSATVDDFVMKVDTVVFPPRTTTMNASVVLNDDTLDEPIQTFGISLSELVNASLDRGQATFNVLDDDPPPILTATGTTVSETDPTATLTFKLSQPTENIVTVVPTLAGHSVTFGDACTDPMMSEPEPVDVLTLPSDLTVTFAPGATTATLVLQLCDDFVMEEQVEEEVSFSIASAVNAILAATSVTATLIDNDF